MRDREEILRAIEVMDAVMRSHDLRTPDFSLAAVVRDALRWVLQEEGEAFTAALEEYERVYRQCLKLIRTNLLLGVEDELARDVLHGLHGALRKSKAELMFLEREIPGPVKNDKFRQMVLMLENRAKEGQYRVAAILQRIARASQKYEVGWFGKDEAMSGTMARPTDYAQVKDIISAMVEVLTTYCAVLTTDLRRKGMVLSQGAAEVALVLNITRFGADIDKGRWRFDTQAPVFDRTVAQDAERIQNEMAKLRGIH